MKRSYTHIKLIEEEINELRESGHTRKEIADKFGLTIIQIKNLVNRRNRMEKKIEAGVMPRRRGRPPKGHQATVEEKDNEIKQLRMENELLRDLLHLAGRW